MKKIIKYSALIVLVVAILILLTGCGEDRIIATMKDSENTIGGYEVKVDILFEGDAISIIKTSMTFDDEKIANLAISGDNEAGIEFQKEGNTITTELTAEEYKKVYNKDFSKMSKKEIIQQLKDEGYTVE